MGRDARLDTYRKLVADLRSTVAPALHQPSNAGGPLAPVEARNLWAPIPQLLEQIDSDLWTLGEQIVRTNANTRLSDSGRAETITEMATAVRQRIESATADVLSRTQQILTITKATALPSRPGPQDAAQEAALAGIKADLRMLWDPKASDELSGLMRRSLGRAIGEDDRLTTWLLASSNWPLDYLESRGRAAQGQTQAWPEIVAAELDAGGGSASLSDARRTYRLLADGRSGLPVLRVLFAQLRPILDDLADWRPTPFAAVPPTHV